MPQIQSLCCQVKSPAVHPVTGEEDPDEDDILQMSVASTIGDSQLVALRPESGSHIRFQVDTRGAFGHLQEGYQRPEPGSPRFLSSALYCPECGRETSTAVKLVNRQDICQLQGRNDC